MQLFPMCAGFSTRSEVFAQCELCNEYAEREKEERKASYYELSEMYEREHQEWLAGQSAREAEAVAEDKEWLGWHYEVKLAA